MGIEVAKRKQVSKVRLSLPYDHDHSKCSVNPRKHTNVKKRASGQPAWRIAGMADLNRRETRLASVIEDCWAILTTFTGDLVNETLAENPFALQATQGSNYDLNVAVSVSSFQSEFTEILLEQYQDSGDYSMREFTKQLSKEYKRFNKSTSGFSKAEDDILASRAVLELKFDRTSPTAMKYAKESSATMVSFLSNSETEAVRDLVGRAFSEQRTYQQTGTALTALLSEVVPQDQVSSRLASMYGVNANGLFPRYANAVANYAEKQAEALASQGITGSKALKTVQERSNRYANKLRRSRAKMIARTEIMQANNAGRLAAAQQAASKGLFDPTRAKRQWISAPQDSCYICNPLNGVAIDFNKSWIEGEPGFVHPNCRCTWLLLPNVPAYGVPSVSGDGTAGNPFVWNMGRPNTSLTPATTGTGTGTTETIPEPKPIQSTSVTDEVAELAEEAAEEAIEQAPAPTVDVTDIDAQVTPANIEEWADTFIWDDSGNTWMMLDEETQVYPVETMIDKELLSAVDEIRNMSHFIDDQGYRLAANAPREVAEEILRLQNEVQEALIQVDISRRMPTLQIGNRSKREAANITTLKGRTIDTGSLASNTVADVGDRFMISPKVVNARAARLADSYAENHIALCEDAVIKIQKLGDVIEKEVVRRADEIATGSGGTLTAAELSDIVQATKRSYDDLLETSGVQYTFDNKSGQLRSTRLDVRSTERFDLKSGVDTSLELVIDSLDETALIADEVWEAAGLTPPQFNDEKTLDLLIKQLTYTSGRNQGDLVKTNVLSRWKGNIDELQIGQGADPGNRFLIDPTAVSADDLVETLDVLQQLITLNSQIQFLDEAVVLSYDEAIEALLKKGRRIASETKSRGASGALRESWNGTRAVDRRLGSARVADTPAGSEYRRRTTLEIQEGFKKGTDQLRKEKELLEEIAPDLLKPVSEKQISGLEDLIDEWIAQEAYLPSEETLQQALYGPDNTLTTVDEWLTGMKQRLTQLKEDAVEELADLTPGTAEYTNTVVRQQKRLFDLMDEYTDVYVAEAVEKAQMIDPSQLIFGEGPNPLLRQMRGRRWNTRGSGSMSVARMQRKMYSVRSNMLLDAYGVPPSKQVGSAGMKRLATARNNYLNTIIEAVGEVDGPTWQRLEEAYPEIFDRVLDPQDLAAKLNSVSSLQSKDFSMDYFGDLLMEGDIKVSDEIREATRARHVGRAGAPKLEGDFAYTIEAVLEQQEQTENALLRLLEQAKRENMAAGKPTADIDLAVIRREVMGEVRESGGDIDFGFGISKGSNTQVGKLGPRAGGDLDFPLPHPETGELVLKMSSSEYGELATQYKDETLKWTPTKWIDRLNATPAKDAVENEIVGKNRVIYSGGGNDRLKWKNFTRQGFYLITDSSKLSKHRAYARSFTRANDISPAWAPDFVTDELFEIVEGSIFMVSDDVPIRGGAINVTMNRLNQSTMSHELMHLFQGQNGTFGDLEKAWYRLRMVRDDAHPERLGNKNYQPTTMMQAEGWGRDEYTIPDELANAYAGRTYKDKSSMAGYGEVVNPELAARGVSRHHDYKYVDFAEGMRMKGGTSRPAEAITMGVEGTLTVRTETGWDPEDALFLRKRWDDNNNPIPLNQQRTGLKDEDFVNWIMGMFGGV